MMDISVIIVNYNVKEYIISCIESIYKHSCSKVNFEVIVIDNNSEDGSTTKIRDLFPQVSLHKNNKNLGFSIAANQAAKFSKGDYILILNPDTLFKDDVLKKLFDEAKNEARLGVLGPSLISESGTVHRSYWRDPTTLTTLFSIFNLDFLNFYKNYNNRIFKKKKKVDTLSGGAFFLRKDVFDKLGGFNDRLFWMEDIDFCVRARQENYSVLYFPEAEVIHFIGKSAEKNIKIAISNQLISKIKFFKIHKDRFSFLVVLFAVTIISSLKTFVLLFLLPFSQLGRKKFIAYAYTLRKVLFDIKSYY